MKLRSFAIIAASFILAACQSTAYNPAKPVKVLLDDSVFPSYIHFPVETEEQVFALSDEAKAFVDEAIKQEDDQRQQIKVLVAKIFDRSDLNLLYRGNANTVASDTFQNRSANCLSMSIMTYALASYAGFDASLQDIDIPEYWTRRDGFSLLNGHVNVRVVPKEYSNIIRLTTQQTIVDFDPQESRKHFAVRRIGKTKTLAMYYNNKGADALIDGSYSKAYAYFRAAAKTAEDFDATWVNLGILYRRSGYHELAMQSYHKAIEIDPENLTAWENIAFLHFQAGDEQKGQTIMARVEKRRQNNPFYHFILGEQAFDAGNMELALGYYRSAFKLDNKRHEVLFGLSKTYYEMGDISRSVRFMKMAEKQAPNDQDAERYQGKLSKLLNT